MTIKKGVIPDLVWNLRIKVRYLSQRSQIKSGMTDAGVRALHLH